MTKQNGRQRLQDIILKFNNYEEDSSWLIRELNRAWSQLEIAREALSNIALYKDVVNGLTSKQTFDTEEAQRAQKALKEIESFDSAEG